MTARQQRLFDSIVGGIVTVILTGLLAFLTGAWSAKESRGDHNADIQAVRADVQRVLDVVCELKPSAQACKR